MPTRAHTMLVLSSLWPLATGCGAKYRHAGMSVQTKGTPAPHFTGNASAVPPAPIAAAHEPAPATAPPVQITPSPVPAPAASGGATPAPAGPTSTPTPAPVPAPAPVIVNPGLQAATGQVVGSVALTMTFGTSPAFVGVQIFRLSGSVAPDCTSGTMVKEYSAPFAMSATFNDETGIAAQVFSYRACFMDNTGNATPGSDQPTALTKPHLMFVTNPSFTGALGGSPKAIDSHCAASAAASPLAALRAEVSWQALVSDSTVNASTKVQVLGAVAAADYSTTKSYHTLAATGTQLWTTGLNASSGSILDASGSPTQSLVWSGSDANGNYVAANACADWSDPSASANGQTGDASTLVGSSWLNGGGPSTCDQLRAIYCISQPAPMLQAVTGATEANSNDLTIIPPPQFMSNATIVIRRRASAAGLPSVACDAPTESPITVVPLGTTPVSFTDNQAAGSTPYNYRACLFDGKSRLVYSTLVLHVTTSP